MKKKNGKKKEMFKCIGVARRRNLRGRRRNLRGKKEEKNFGRKREN